MLPQRPPTSPSARTARRRKPADILAKGTRVLVFPQLACSRALIRVWSTAARRASNVLDRVSVTLRRRPTRKLRGSPCNKNAHPRVSASRVSVAAVASPGPVHPAARHLANPTSPLRPSPNRGRIFAFSWAGEGAFQAAFQDSDGLIERARSGFGANALGR